ncbi:MAG: hypothetical protein J6M91_03815 [Methanobrevibacter sp.]|nr:hypothetical protein [Methanobrevibacter sp.]
MATIEDIMLTISAKDNASSVFKGVGSNARSMASSATQAINSMNSGFMNLSQVSNSVMSSLSNGKSASDLLFGTTSKAETNSVLVNLMSSTEEAAAKLNKHVDDVTNNSLVSMQNLIPALNAVKTATGATDDQIYGATDTIANFGAKVLAQTGSVEESEQAMMDLSKGIKGACASLDQYGITTDALKRTGKWTGDENDIEGYMAAVKELTGDTQALMDTNEGLDARLGKAFSSAGKKIGNEILPQIKDVKKAFLDINSSTGGTLAATIIAAAEGVDIFSQGMTLAAETSQGIKGIRDGFDFAKEGIKGATEWLNKFREASEAAAVVQYSDAIGPLPQAGAATVQYAPGATDILPAVGDTDVWKSVYDELNVSNQDMNRAAKLLEDDDELVQFGKLIEQHNDDLDDALSTFKKTGDLSKYEKDVKAINKEKENLFKYIEEFGEISPLVENMDFDVPDIGKMDTFNKTAELMDDMPDVKDFTKVTETTEEVVESASSMGKVGPKASAAGASMQASSGGLSAISAGAASMLVPLLSIAVVVAVMIPVVTALAAEALLCMKGLQLLVDALDFGGVDLNDDLDGIKKIGEVLLNIGIVMGEMSFAGIMTGVYAFVSGLFLVVDPIQMAVDQIKNVVPIINQLGSVENIDENIPGKLEKLGSSLASVSKATEAMTSTTVTTGWGNFVAWIFNFSSTTDSISQAKEDLIKAAGEINQLQGLPQIDEGVSNKLKSIGDSLKGASDAISALRSLRDGQNWDAALGQIFNGVDIQTALTTVKKDIENAANALNNFGNLPQIPQDVGNKLKSIGDSLKGVSDAFKALRAMRDDFNWDQGLGQLFNGVDIQSALTSIKSDIERAANTLNTFNTIPQVQEGIATKVTRVADATKVVANAVNVMNGANIPDVGVISALPAKISAAKNVVQQTATELNGLQSIQAIPDGLYTKVSRVGTSAQNVGTSVSAIRSIPQVDQGASMKVKLAVDAVRKTATELNRLNGTNVADVQGILSSVRNAMNQLRSTLSSMGGSFQASSQGIGAGIKAGVVAGMAGMAGDVNAQASAAVAMFTATMTAGGTAAGNGARTAFQGSFKLAAIAQAEMNYAVQAVNSGAGALADACRRAAEQAVQAAKDGAEHHSPGAIARMWGQEVGGYSVEKVKSGARLLVSTVKSVSQSVVNAWGSPSLSLGSTVSGMTPGKLSNMSLLSKAMPVMNGEGKVINFNIMSGAFKLDARNLTQAECQKIVTLGLEGITQVTDVKIRGVR